MLNTMEYFLADCLKIENWGLSSPFISVVSFVYLSNM